MGGSSTYLGAAPIVKILEMSRPNVIITSRVADASLFLGPMIYELGWNWDDFHKLAQGTLAGHLLECGCQVTGGYFAHPDNLRNMPIQRLLDISLPYAEVSNDGDVIIAKPKGTGGELSFATCAQQLLYEVGDPSAYITPDLIVDFTHVMFEELTTDKVRAKGALPAFSLRPERLLRLIPQECGWKAWGEISYGGEACVERAKMAETLVVVWMEESIPGSSKNVMTYLIGIDSLFIHPVSSNAADVRLRVDGVFALEEQAIQFMHEFEALYTNGPAGGGGISVGYRKEMLLEKILVKRDETFWDINIKATEFSADYEIKLLERTFTNDELEAECFAQLNSDAPNLCRTSLPAPAGVELPLYKVVHSRTGDKGNDLNFSLIPHCASDLQRLQVVITKDWVRQITQHLSKGWRPTGENVGEVDEEISIEIYVVDGIHAMNVVIRNALDGGVNVSRRIDRHGKSLSDLILCQVITLPPTAHQTIAMQN